VTICMLPATYCTGGNPCSLMASLNAAFCVRMVTARASASGLVYTMTETDSATSPLSSRRPARMVTSTRSEGIPKKDASAERSCAGNAGVYVL
jgi:hypothetical protein